MKRSFAWSIVSVLTFLVGNIVVYAYWSLPAAAEVKKPIAAPPVAVTAPTQSTVTNTSDSAEDDFNAEIHDIDLANLGLEREPNSDFSSLIDEGKLEVSNYYDEIKRGDKRLVMFEDNGQYRIRRSAAIFTSRKVEGDFSIVTIEFKGRGKPVFIFPELSFLKSGAIRTLYVRPTQKEIDDRGLPIGYSLWKNETRWFALGDKNYTGVRVSKGLASDGKKLDILVLEKESERQVIDAIPYYGESDYGFADIIWAGDLDRDGKLDLITDGSEGYMLYISSQAEYGRLVKLVSSGGVRGC